MASDNPRLRSTPGVYVTEADAFGSSIVGVSTAVPIFVGYTEFAGDPVTGAAPQRCWRQSSDIGRRHSFRPRR